MREMVCFPIACHIIIVLLPLVLHSVSSTICMSTTACMQDNHAHPVAPNLKEEKKIITDTVLRQKLLISGEISI